MNCPECHDFWQLRLDGDSLPDRVALDHHLAECPECREQHLAAQHLAAGLRFLVPPAPPTDLARRIASRVLTDRIDQLRWRRRVFAAAAVAACLALMTSAGYQAQRLGLLGPGDKDDRRANKDGPARHDKRSPGK